jgi:membrane complex biogenesis BtpA family protein
LLEALGFERPVLIGMVHLPALPGAPRSSGDMAEILRRAETDAEALAAAGFDAVIVENFLDAPFHPGPVPAITVAAMTRAVAAVRERVPIPVGVNVLRNDAAAALSIAAVTGAAFVRVNVHTGAMWTDQGLVTGRAYETLRLRRRLEAPVAILADVHVKHAIPPAGASLRAAAQDTWSRGLADGLVVSGVGTGLATDDADVAEVIAAVPDAPVFVGSGATEASVSMLPPGVWGAIVGSAVMVGGKPGAGVDPARARALVTAARKPEASAP